MIDMDMFSIRLQFPSIFSKHSEEEKEHIVSPTSLNGKVVDEDPAEEGSYTRMFMRVLFPEEEEVDSSDERKDLAKKDPQVDEELNVSSPSLNGQVVNEDPAEGASYTGMFRKVLFPEPSIEEEVDSSDAFKDLAEDDSPSLQDRIGDIADFSKTVLVKKLVETGKAIVGENVGMLVGATFPEASMAYAVGKSVANQCVDDRLENKSKIVQGVGVLAGLTTVALQTGLQYLMGTSVDYGQALGYMVRAGGTIAGGMIGLEAMGQEVPDGYIPRTAAYLVTNNAVTQAVSAVNSSSLPTAVSATVSGVGAVAKTVLATSAYYAPEVASIVPKVIEKVKNRKSGKKNLFDPGNFVQEMAVKGSGSSDKLAADLVEKIFDKKGLISSLAARLVGSAIDSKVTTNAMVRAVNDFIKIMQENKITEKLKNVRTPEEDKKIKEEIKRLITAKYGIMEWAGASVAKLTLEQQLKPVVDELVTIFSTRAKDFAGLHVKEDDIRKQLMLFVPVLIPMIAVYIKRSSTSSAPLLDQEVTTFYQNLINVATAPFQDYLLVRGVQGLASVATPLVMKMNFIPALLATKMGQLIHEPVIKLDGDKPNTLPKAASTESSHTPPQASKWKRVLSLFKTFKMGLSIAWTNRRARGQIVKDLISVFLRMFSRKKENTVIIPHQDSQNIKGESHFYYDESSNEESKESDNQKPPLQRK